MNDSSDTLDCFDCGTPFERAFVLASPAEFMVDVAGILCPICGDGHLRDTSTINQQRPVQLFEVAYTRLGVIAWQWYSN